MGGVVFANRDCIFRSRFLYLDSVAIQSAKANDWAKKAHCQKRTEGSWNMSTELQGISYNSRLMASAPSM